MVVTFSGSNMIKIAKILVKIIILVIILSCILPQLLSLLWYIHYPEPKMKEEHLLEKPLRVTATIVEVG